MRAQFRITPNALEDLKSIAHYTRMKWGNAQRAKYLRDLDSQFCWLAENPHLGKHRKDIVEGYYSFPQGSHVIFYLIHEDGIDIIGVPHQEMDILNYFDEQ